MKHRVILCQADRRVLGDQPLSMWVKLLARAIAEHIEDWAVVIEPGISATLYRLGHEPRSLLHFRRLEALIAEVGALRGLSPSAGTNQFLVVQPDDDVTLVEFLGGIEQSFHVVSPLVQYSERFAASPSSAITWLRAGEGKVRPAIVLPNETSGHAGPVSFYSIEEGWRAANAPERDACRIRVNAARLPAAINVYPWSKVEAAVCKPFERWARTLTGRRVGLTLSGGGAAVMRLVPMFRALENARVPIDIISGTSGSAAFAACYATGGLPKVMQLADRGLSILLTATVPSMITSTVVQRYLDRFFDNCGVCNTEIRIIPMATTISSGRPPRAAVVVDGTLGEALRASGILPVIGPYALNGVRHVDGSVLAGLPPPEITRQFGADIVFAMNVFAVPSNRYPGENNPILSKTMGLLYHHSPLGRVADTISAISMLMHAVSEGHGRTADLFIDAPPRDGAIFEPPLLFNAPKYAREGLGPTVDIDAIAADCHSRWRRIGEQN